MDRRSLALCLALFIALDAVGGCAAAQPDQYTKLIGTWVMDTTNGPDDNGLPKSEKLVLSRKAAGLRITASEDDGQGASTSAFNCQGSPAGGITDLGKGQSMKCTVHPIADSVMYALDVINGTKKASPVERGWLVVQSNGLLRDEYDAFGGSASTHHRHIYHKVS
jgi:hypothetical protein